MKQILTLERERVSGGDGFLTAAQTAAKARGEIVEVGSKKKKANPVGAAARKGNVGNLKGRRSGVGTPLLGEEGSGMTTLADDGEEEEGGGADGADDVGVRAGDGGPRKEIITCQWINYARNLHCVSS